MDKSTPESQVVFRDLAKRREKLDMDRYFRLCAGHHYQKAARSQGRSLHYFTGSKSCPVRENTIRSNTYESAIQLSGTQHG